MEAQKVIVHHIPASNGVDPIDVFIACYGKQAFQVTIRCWDCAWTFLNGVCRHELLRFALFESFDFLNGVCRHELESK